MLSVNCSHCIQVGEAGLGKTTFIQNLQAALQPDAPAPSGNPQQGNAAEVLQLFEEKPELFSTEVVIQNGNVQCHYLLQVCLSCPTSLSFVLANVCSPLSLLV